MTDPNTPAHHIDRIPIPIRLVGTPTTQGMVVPFVTLAHRDRSRPVWGKLDPTRLREVLQHRLCQICGQPLTDPVVLYLRPADYLRGIAVEPGLHPECGLYSRQVCPMLSGAVDRYNPHPTYHRCTDPTCTCARWVEPEPAPGEAVRDGQPAEAWYEAWMALGDYAIVSEPGTENTAPATGVDLRPSSRIRRLRRIREAAPGAHPLDLLAALIATRALFTSAGEPE